MTTFLISDTHFGHAGILRLCQETRKFSDVREMDGMMISNWNATVRPDDTVIHLGDFAYRYPADRLPKLFASLNGHKHLIKGNHDDKHTLALGWESVRDIAYTSIDSQLVVLCHCRATCSRAMSASTSWDSHQCGSTQSKRIWRRCR
jgi:calcineurin-like phosphoesterase family protein